VSISRKDYQKLREEVDDNLEKMSVEFEKFQELMEGRNASDGPKDWRHKELVAERLHRFYSGVEQVMKRIANRLDGGTPEGKHWHKELLKQMSRHGEARPPLFSEDIRQSLLDFQGFRHFYRESYLVDLQWEQMTSLINEFEDLYESSTKSIETFIENIEP
jgi:hypothetical protein